MTDLEVDSGTPNFWNHNVGDFKNNVSSSTPAIALVDQVSAVRTKLDTSICN